MLACIRPEHGLNKLPRGFFSTRFYVEDHDLDLLMEDCPDWSYASLGQEVRVLFPRG
jgi:hypothetical protein